jgi:hypothetical protein
LYGSIDELGRTMAERKLSFVASRDMQMKSISIFDGQAEVP